MKAILLYFTPPILTVNIITTTHDNCTSTVIATTTARQSLVLSFLCLCHLVCMWPLIVMTLDFIASVFIVFLSCLVYMSQTHLTNDTRSLASGQAS